MCQEHTPKIMKFGAGHGRRSAGPLVWEMKYRGAVKSLARPGRKQTTATEDFEFHISYLLS
jgi:hypothetical protein